MAVTIMPMADGEVYNNLLKDNVLNLKEKIELFNYTIDVLICMLKNHELVYPDLKGEQLLFFKCPHPEKPQKYILLVI